MAVTCQVENNIVHPEIQTLSTTESHPQACKVLAIPKSSIPCSTPWR